VRRPRRVVPHVRQSQVGPGAQLDLGDRIHEVAPLVRAPERGKLLNDLQARARAQADEAARARRGRATRLPVARRGGEVQDMQGPCRGSPRSNVHHHGIWRPR
jgi:hypothetical protein